VTLKLVDLAKQYGAIGPDVDEAIRRVVQSGVFIGGDEVAQFEREWAAFCECRHAVGVANGTDALELALRALELPAGFGVLTVANTFVATVEAIVNAGGTPTFCDVTADTLLLDPDELSKKLTPSTRVVMPVHLYGAPADMGRISEFARRHALHVVEDAAQAHGARCEGRPVGRHAAATIFSFYPGKNLGAYGDAGAVVTDDEALAGRVCLLRDHGRTSKYLHESIGRNSRLDALQAAILRAKLPHLGDWNQRRRELYAMYTARFAGSRVRVVGVPEYGESVHHLMVVRVPATERDRCIERLKAKHIECGIHYPVPLHRQPAVEAIVGRCDVLPETDRASGEIVSLPMYPELSEADVDFVASELLNA
jgi:dTDP-4-amino-4,6-dideoxygalactose transaminase